ncbi:hypothetical protein N7535_003640 [Penicillium sp. DV-2018c]|nr:hypothetical protein N7461_000657 [Penicillium sp. DV-2018c]KAJ5576714.1 hypothetical protein N7535_003640 [Penicillium sp. DV-2018c]
MRHAKKRQEKTKIITHISEQSTPERQPALKPHNARNKTNHDSHRATMEFMRMQSRGCIRGIHRTDLQLRRPFFGYGGLTLF